MKSVIKMMNFAAESSQTGPTFMNCTANYNINADFFRFILEQMKKKWRIAPENDDFY